MAATRDSPRREPRSSRSNSSSRTARRSTTKSPGTFAFEAHQEARELAREVGAPPLPLFYAPKRLRTYRSRGVNSFKAPNPALTRFSLPGEDEVVYPDDSPVRRPAAKRGFAAEPSSATGSPIKRVKVDHPLARAPTPRSVAKRDFAQVETGSDDYSPTKRQRSSVTDDASDSDIDESLQTLSPIKKEELQGLIRKCSKRSFETSLESEVPTERPPLKYLVRGSKRQKSQSEDSQIVERRTPLETTVPIERVPSSHLTQRSSTAESKNSTERPSSSHIVRGTNSLFQQKEESSSGQAEATLPARFTPVSRNSLVQQKEESSSGQAEATLPARFTPVSRNSLFQQKEESSSGQAEATLPARFTPVSRNRRTRAALKNAASSSTPLSPSLPTRSPEAPEAPQASQDCTATSEQPIERHQGPAGSDQQPVEPHQDPAVVPIQPQEFAPAHVQPVQIPRQQLFLTTIKIMMAITIHFWNIATFFPRLFAIRAQAAPVANDDPAKDDSAVGQDASVNRVIPGAFPTVDDTPLPLNNNTNTPLNNDTHQHPIHDDDDDDWTVRYRPSNGVTDTSTDVNSHEHDHESTQAIQIEELQSKIQALEKEKLRKEQEIETELKALEQENMAKDQQIRTIEEQLLAINDLQGKLTVLEHVYQDQEQQNLVIEELESALAVSRLTTRLLSFQQGHNIGGQQNLATRKLQEKLQILKDKALARQRQSASLSRRNTTLETISAQHRASKRYSDQPEEWRLDDAARRQLHHESFDANYEFEKDRILAANGYKYTTLTVEESEQCTKFATLSSPSNSARVRRAHKDPRDFFDNDDEVSLATSFARASLAPSSRQLVSDSAECATREEEQRRLEIERLREETDALLKPRGLRTPRAPVILELPGGDWARRVEATVKPGWPETGQKTKTCGPESIELGMNDFKRMVPDGVWLNDSCIQAAVQYTAEYVNTRAGVTLKKDTPKCVGLNSFFWPAIVSKTVPQKKRMLKRLWGLTPENFLDVESIIIPINANAHWTFLFIRPQRREIAYVDSFHSTGEDRIEGGLEFVSIFLGPLYKAEEWSRVSFEVPRQTNGYDCGMFVITNSLLLALGLDPIGYKQADMGRQRRVIAAMILNGGWHGQFDLSKL